MRHDAICSGDHLGSDTDCDREVEVIQRAKRMPFHIFQEVRPPARTDQGGCTSRCPLNTSAWNCRTVAYSISIEIPVLVGGVAIGNGHSTAVKRLIAARS